MRTRVYEVQDHDILATFFGDDMPVRRVAELGQDHGELIFDGELDNLPQRAGLLLIDGAEGVEEYVVVQELIHADTNTAILIVHAPHYDEGTLS